MTISELEKLLAQKIQQSSFVGANTRVRVELRDSKNRKKRCSASADNWRGDHGDIGVFWLETTQSPQMEQMLPVSRIPASAIGDEQSIDKGPVEELVECLASAEARPGYQFVALKWFRDSYLPGQKFEWTANADRRNRVLADAIHDGLVATNKIPNPRQPFPTTTIHVNRSNPRSRNILGLDAQPGWNFEPVEIRGEAISKTMLRDRG